MSPTLTFIIWLIVWNNSASGKLLSLNKSIRSSSTKNVFGIDLVLQKAVDGNHTTNIECCCAMTGYDSHAWFELDLGRKYLIVRVVVESVPRYFVDYGEHVEFFLVPEQEIEAVKPVKIVTPEKDIGRLNFTFPEPRESRFLTMVRRTGRKYRVFVVCELSVYGELLFSPECEDGKYGSDCSKDCGKCYNMEPCNKFDGTCSRCADGYSGLKCNSHCGDGKYGSNCSKDCGKCFNQVPCNKTDGTCSSCAAGYFGPKCNSQNSDGKVACPDSIELIGMTIGVTIAAILMVESVIAAVIYVIWKRKCKRTIERLDQGPVVQDGEPHPEISGPYELADRSAFATEHPYGEVLPDYEEPVTHYEN